MYDEIRIEDAGIDDSEDSENPINPEDRIINFDTLKAKYSDIIAWIYVPGTHIDYPVLKGTDDYYYLNHTPEKQYNKLGSIYVPAATSSDLSDAHTVIYGHNMKSGRMFGDLKQYADKDFRDSYPYVYIYLPEKTLKCEVYNAYTCVGGDENYKIQLERNSESYTEWLKSSLRPATYSDQLIELKEDMQVISLSTCTSSGSVKNRFIVHCAVIAE